MDPGRYPPSMHHPMGDAGGGSYQPAMSQRQQMGQQPPPQQQQQHPSPLTMQIPQAPQHGHPGGQHQQGPPAYPPPMTQYPGGDGMAAAGSSGQVVATPTSAVMQSPRLPAGPPAVLEVTSRVDEATGRRYSLVVEQQPKRARMCGFGDKDRRPITPPPCVRLVVTDVATGKDVDINHIEHAMFVLNVDLWNEDGTHEVNLVRHAGGTPSISSTTPASYASLTTSTPAYANTVLPSHQPESPYGGADMGYGQVMPQYGMQGGYGGSPYGSAPPSAYPQSAQYVSPSYSPATQYYPSQGDYRGGMGSVAQLPSNASMSPYSTASPGFPDLGRMGHSQPQGMYTRNLIGSLAASAFKLDDTRGKIGIWFVLQDLSVRTEGHFRLRFSFVNVAAHPGERNGSIVTHLRSPIMASCFSDVFTVFSAKKFPGVCESTELSKKFAGQGIKIPIRKDTNGRAGDEEEEY